MTESARDLRLLGLGPSADWSEIQAAYHRLAMELHPDRRVAAERASTGDADAPPHTRAAAGAEDAARFREVNEAYERLRRERIQARLRSREHITRIVEDPMSGRMPTEEIVLRLKYSASPQLRAASALLLARRSGAQISEALKDACRDADPLVREAAREALGKTGGWWSMLRYRVAAAFRRGPK